MKFVIANLAFVLTLMGLVLTGFYAEFLPLPVAAFFTTSFGVGSYAAGIWLFKGRL